MAQYPLDLRRKRILREENDIFTLDQRIEETTRARDAAVHAFEQARTVMDDVTKELATLYARRDAARDELGELRLSYRRDFMANLPLDVLACIFGEVSTLPPGFVDAFRFDTCYRRTCAFAPFALAAVCRRWRTQALRQPSLWTYVSTPYHMSDYATVEAHQQRIDCILERSQSHPLDILICWKSRIEARFWDALDTILTTIQSCAIRWRTFELSLPKGRGKVEYTYALNGPLPLLESYRIASIEDGRYHVIDGCFPFAPQLRGLTIWGPNAVQPTLLGLPSLRSLRLWYHLSLSEMLPLLSAVSATLDSLAVGIDREGAMQAHNLPCVLPKLTTLSLDIDENLSHGTFQQLVHVRLPALQHLLLTGNTIVAELTPFLEAIAGTTHTLTLGDRIRSRHLNVLHTLSGLRTLVFDDFNEIGEPECAYTADDAFFATISLDINPDLWPKLACVRLEGNGEFNLGSGSGILSFVRSRSRSRDAGDADETAPCRLQTFDVQHEVPEWLTAEIARLLQK